MTKTVALLVAGVLAFPGLTLAQGDYPQRQDEQAGQGMMGMMPCPSASMILKQKEALDLTESQVEGLEAIQKEASEAREAHMGQVRPLHMQVMQALEGDEPFRPSAPQLKNRAEQQGQENRRRNQRRSSKRGRMTVSLRR